MYTSLEFSKKLAEAGFEGEYKKVWLGYVDVEKNTDNNMCLEDGIHHPYTKENEHYPAYDILNDLCVKYAKEAWGEGQESTDEDNVSGGVYWHQAVDVIFLLQMGKQDEAEQYILDNSILFNKD